MDHLLMKNRSVVHDQVVETYERYMLSCNFIPIISFGNLTETIRHAMIFRII